MTKPNDGGPAFPQGPEWGSSKPVPEGMSLRDYFAAKAMQGICATDIDREWSAIQTANRAYFVADAMLRERDKPTEETK